MRFPLKDVEIRHVSVAKKVLMPLYADSYWQMNQHEFAMQVEGVAEFYACDGKVIEYALVPGADENAVELYLNGSVYGAILHQRKVIPLHGSSFRYRGLGIMICGDTGAGKSSLTASFCINGAEFLTDDVTPVLLKSGTPYIWAMSDRMKLWRDTLVQLGREEDELHRIHPEMEKFFYTMNTAAGNIFRLDQICILMVKETKTVEFEELTGSSKFSALRNEIYRPEYLNGMPDNAPVYFGYLIDISNNVRVTKVSRPEEIRIQELMISIEEHTT